MNEGAGVGLGKALRYTSQDGYGGDGAKIKTLQVGGGGERAVCGYILHIYSIYKGVKLLGTQSQFDLIVSIKIYSRGKIIKIMEEMCLEPTKRAFSIKVLSCHRKYATIYFILT